MLNKDNFWIASLGEWIELTEIPVGFNLFFTSKDNSKYYLKEDKTEIIRVSNHWGSGISQCNWYLKGYQRSNSYNWKTTNIGWIAFSSLIDIRID